MEYINNKFKLEQKERQDLMNLLVEFSHAKGFDEKNTTYKSIILWVEELALKEIRDRDKIIFGK